LSQNLSQFVDSSLGAGSVSEYRQNSNQATDPNQAVNRLKSVASIQLGHLAPQIFQLRFLHT
jgi:hypothetical protein